MKKIKGNIKNSSKSKYMKEVGQKEEFFMASFYDEVVYQPTQVLFFMEEKETKSKSRESELMK